MIGSLRMAIPIRVGDFMLIGITDMKKLAPEKKHSITSYYGLHRRAGEPSDGRSPGTMGEEAQDKE